ncbi:protein Gawky-like isoform X2 [Nilaparvata lugens]|nr:protein Gawky-like isoform X1 [Nilaparvata lugens]XP_039289654.1 protein Gawky-like isoform X2 [Nilaparvata lugens]
MKSIEDDPTITPGSLQQASAVLTPKGNSVVTSVADDMFGRGGGGGGKVSPPPGPMTADMPPIPSLSLSSSTWSFQPTSQSSFNSPLSKMSMSGGGVGMKTSSQGVGWGGGDPHGGGADMWKSRQGGGGGGPPPGLSKTLPPTAAPSNGWGSLSGRWGPPQHTTWGQPPPAHALWLLLKNLTPQIDGSTLKTLCVQHGPLQSFHMYLPHGIAFAKYSTREEATKAQNALNNCVLGNTTIFADVQPEREIVALLNQLGNSGGGGGGNSQAGAAAGDGNSPWSSSRQPQPKQVVDTWGSGSQLWGGGGGGGTSSSLWGAALDSDRSTPSTASLNSFLPPDLLGGESM